MRLVILVNDALTHDSRLFKEARHLHRAGYDVHVFGNQPTAGGLETSFVRDGCAYHRPAGYPSRAFRRRASWNIQAVRFVLRLRPRVILAHRWNTLMPATVGSFLTGATIVYDNRELFGGGDFNQRSMLWKQAFWFGERTLARACRSVIMSSHGRAEDWARKYRRPKPLVMYDCTEKRDVPASDILRRELGLGKDRKVLMYVGGLAAGRGLMPAMEALAMLPPQYVFVAMGKNDGFVRELRDHAAKLGVQDRFFIHAPVRSEDIPTYVSSADATLCTFENISRSYYHSVPQKFYESLQAGIPVVASDFPEQGRLVRRFQVGVCVRPDDVRDIVRGILEVTGGQVAPAQWRQRCKIAADAMTWENEVKVLLEAVRQAGDRCAEAGQ